MASRRTFIEKMEQIREDLQVRNNGFYVSGKYERIRKKGTDFVHLIPFQELTVGSLTLSPGYASILYKLGKMSGEYTTIQSIKYLKLGSIISMVMKTVGPYEVLKRESLTKNIVNSWENMGYGHISIKEVDAKKKRVIFVIEECAFCSGLKNVGEKICFNQAGLLAGMLKGTFGRDFYCIETKCVASGDRHCEFEVREEKT